MILMNIINIRFDEYKYSNSKNSKNIQKLKIKNIRIHELVCEYCDHRLPELIIIKDI